MKYIKTYETLEDNDIQIGDYIKCDIRNFGPSKKDKLWEDYINKAIGKIIELPILDNMYQVMYILTDKIIKQTFSWQEMKFVKTNKETNEKYIIMKIPLKHIIYNAKTLEELELKITTDKYNL